MEGPQCFVPFSAPRSRSRSLAAFVCVAPTTASASTGSVSVSVDTSGKLVIVDTDTARTAILADDAGFVSLQGVQTVNVGAGCEVTALHQNGRIATWQETVSCLIPNAIELDGSTVDNWLVLADFNGVYAPIPVVVNGGRNSDYIKVGGFRSATINGGGGGDTIIDGSSGTVASTGGRDSIDVANGLLNTVDCGGKSDAVKFDGGGIDTLLNGC